MSTRQRLAVLASLLALVCISAGLRVRAALGDPNFDAAHSDGLLKSDPGLLFYLTERIIDADGGTPSDWRADPRVQHPYRTDIPAEFTVGQEFLLAWTQLGLRQLGFEPPLHLTALWLFAFLASLSVLGVFGLARELTRPRTSSLLPAYFAAILWGLLPANYRTMGFILVREDLALPALSIALWLVARAARRQSSVAWFEAGLAVAVALSTWHAMGFFLVLLLLAPVAWLMRWGQSPCARTEVLWVSVAPLAAALCVPALRSAGSLGSLPFLLATALFGAGWAQRRGARWGTRLALGLGCTGALVILAGALGVAAKARGSYAHVWDVMLAKLRLLGVPPLDPNQISFDARLLWQGPFETMQPEGFLYQLGWGLFFLGAGLPLVYWGWGPRSSSKDDADSRTAFPRVSEGEALLIAAVFASLPAAWLVARVVILPGLLLPVLAAVILARIPRAAALLAVGTPILLLQAWTFFLPLINGFASSWYLPPGRQEEIAALVQWVGQEIPKDEAISTDFMNGTALLAHCGNPIVLQPKYETDRSRRQAERFLSTFFFGSPAEFLALVRTEFQTRYLLIDRYTLGILSRWTAGLADNQPLPVGSAAELFLSRDAEVLENVAGTSLLYRSPKSIRQSNGEPYDLFRLYRLEELQR